MRKRRSMESLEGKMTEPLNSGNVSTRLQRIVNHRVRDSHGAKPWPEEPDAGNPHVRICEGGRALPYPLLDIKSG